MLGYSKCIVEEYVVTRIPFASNGFFCVALLCLIFKEEPLDFLMTVLGQVVGSHVHSVPNCRISKHICIWKGIFVGAAVAALVQVNQSA